MAVNTLTFNQCSTLLNAINAQATGRAGAAPVNTSEFVTVAQTTLMTGYDNVINAISQVLSKTVFSVRPYNRKFKGLYMDAVRYGNHTRKLQVVDKDAKDDDRVKLVDGESVDQQEVNKPAVLQTNFYGANVYERFVTIFRDQLDSALRDANEFGRWLSALMTHIDNRHKQVEEAEARAIIANFITAKKTADTSNAINVLQAYYDETGVTLTPADMFAPTNYVEFTRWLAAFMQTLVDKMGERSLKYHMNITGKEVMRFTSPDNMRKYLSDKVINNIVAVSQSVLYNADKISNIVDGAKKMTFWQNIDNPYSVQAKPAYLNTTTGNIDVAGSAVQVDNIIGVLFDRDALGMVKRSTWSAASEFNPAGGFYNLYWHWTQTTWNSFDENFVLLYADTVTP